MERMRVAVVKEAARATAVNFAAWEFNPAAAPVAETRSRKEDMADMIFRCLVINMKILRRPCNGSSSQSFVVLSYVYADIR